MASALEMEQEKDLDVSARVSTLVSCLYWGTGHNKFVRGGPTLSGVGGYQRHHPSCEHYRQNFFGFQIWLTQKYLASKSQHC